MNAKEAAQAALRLYDVNVAQLDADPFPTPEAVDDYLRERGYDPVVQGRRGAMLARNLWEWERDREAKEA